MSSIIFDTETSGLFKRGAHYKKLEEFDKARLVSISWILARGDSIVEQSYFIIKPDNFEISQESINIHGISQSMALEQGQDVKYVLDKFMETIKKNNVHAIVAHNIQFDENIIKSELYRYKMVKELDVFNSINKICTMQKGRILMKVKKFPKLAELYRYLYGEDIVNAHDALYDTLFCFRCFIKIFPADPSIIFFGNKQVSLTDEQQRFVFEDLNRNILVVASAGSGKTSSIISRIKFMIDNGASESSIVLLTFTRNSARDMKDKLYEIMGYIPQCSVGTIDSFARSNLELNGIEYDVDNINEYGPAFLNFIKKKPDFCQKYKYLIVDEFQDINDIQFQIIDEFYKNGVDITGVGDKNQNIYSFRKSDIKYIVNFSKTFSRNHVTHYLTKNFRSSSHIVELANACCLDNLRMISCVPHMDYFKKPIIAEFETTTEQNLYVVGEINRLIHSNSHDIKFEDICIMSALNKPLFEMVAVLNKNGISNYNSSAGGGNTDDDSRETVKIGSVTISTIHRAKGLEWKVVFIINASDEQNKNVYRYQKNISERESLIEANKRLFYVAITRAKFNLYILNNSMGDLTRFVSTTNNLMVHNLR
jgi:superfamily I DNA/RNA helicase